MIPVQVTIRDLPSSPTLETHIRDRADKLSQFYSRLTSCRVVVELLQKNKHQGKLYNVRIDITVPGKELVVTRKYDQDVYVAIRDAFKAIERQLEELSRKRHGRIKTHDETIHGHIVRYMPQEGYGFIEGVDGHEYYFSATNVKASQFSIGDAVIFNAEMLNEGRQALHVIKERNHA